MTRRPEPSPIELAAVVAELEAEAAYSQRLADIVGKSGGYDHGRASGIRLALKMFGRVAPVERVSARTLEKINKTHPHGK